MINILFKLFFGMQLEYSQNFKLNNQIRNEQ